MVLDNDRMTANSDLGLFVIRAGGTMFALSAKIGERLRIIYCGPDLEGSSADELLELSHQDHAPGGPEEPIRSSWLNCVGTGHTSPPGLLMHAGGKHWCLDPLVSSAEIRGSSCIIHSVDQQSQVKLYHTLQIDQLSGVAHLNTKIVNGGLRDFSLEWCSVVCLPIHPRLDKIINFSGKWAGEFQTEHQPVFHGSFLKENRSGRTSHASYPGIYLGEQTTSETSGHAAAFHLSWTGNHRLRVDKTSDGSVSFQAGELLLPGEITLKPGEEYESPQLIALWSQNGFGEVTQRLHAFVRNRIIPNDCSRPVHFNTWEAVYFDHSEENLFALAKQAAKVGAERFVLDDGWFGSRRSDKAGLGDWEVSKEIYPQGLSALADHVRSLGMEFGLWFEPEMINPDSDLYRKHPDWVLKVEGLPEIKSRNQFPLDLTKLEVRDYLFERIGALIRKLSIGYIKWDMNRDIQHPGDSDGHPIIHDQTRALYSLIDRIRESFPNLVIESCSSGGARADYGILQRTGRIWPSDNNEARTRSRIMRGAAFFLPLSCLGNHVGPESCHITGRRLQMHFRAGAAVFGHMGMELDLSKETEEDLKILASAIDLHKETRLLIHGGNYHRLKSSDDISAISIVSNDRKEAVIQILVLDTHPFTQPPLLAISGLEAEKYYQVSLVWPHFMAKDCGRYSGASLIGHGIQIPQTQPDYCLIYRLEEVV